MVTFTLEELASRTGARLDGDVGCQLVGVASLEEAGPEEISFLANSQYERFLKTTRAGAVIVAEGQDTGGIPCLRAANPYLTFARVVELFHPPVPRPGFGISDRAYVDPGAELGDGAEVFPGAFISAGARLGERVTVYPGVFVDRDVVVGDACVLYANVTLYRGSRIGNRVIIHAGAVVASDGFGYARTDEGSYHKIPQVGTVVVADDVEIGANTTIDRAALGETRIGRGTKIDNQVMIAHNVQVGEDCLLISQVGVSGSSKLGDRVVLAGQVGLVGHIEVGSDAVVGAQSGVSRSLDGGQVYLGAPAVPIGKAKKQYALISRLPRMREQLQQARQQIAKLERRLASLEAREDDA